jgi:hypothetical protein
MAPSAELAKLQAAHTEARAKVRALRDKREQWNAETEELRAAYTAHSRAHPEEHRDAAGNPAPDTESARLQDAIKARQAKGNPAEDAYHEGRAAYGEADERLAAFKLATLEERIRELDPEFATARDVLREGFEQILAACEVAQNREAAVRNLVTDCPGMTGQCIDGDGRLPVWAEVARAALDSDLVPAGLNPAGRHKLGTLQ